jgi:diketogulonate reductase-like aldo/keto reductase
MKSLTDSYELSNGVKIPCLGFGTWQTPNGEVAVSLGKWRFL